MIHKFQLDDHRIVLDVNSGAVHLVDELVYDLLDNYDGDNEVLVLQQWSDKYSSVEINGALAELKNLQNEGLLFSPDLNLPDVFRAAPIVKSLCIHTSHACNLRCRYCFAEGGDFGDTTGSLMMSKEIGEQAIDFAIKNSSTRKNLELDFFGGEPLTNWQVTEHLINYARQQGKLHEKNIKLTLTTNCTLITDEISKFLTEQNVMLVLSLDGRPAVHDKMRPCANGSDSYEQAIAGFKKVIATRGDRNYYIRGTFTRENMDFSKDVLHLAQFGKELSLEPVVTKDERYAFTEKDLPELYQEYDELARQYLAAKKRGDGFNFFHFNVALDNGPCLAKRLSGCGAGHEYFAVTPDGDLYPCHQFVGREEYKVGSISTGVENKELSQKFRGAHILNKPECQKCWAKFHCSGGCHANAELMNGDILQPYELGCALQKKRLECGILLQAVLSE